MNIHKVAEVRPLSLSDFLVVDPSNYGLKEAYKIRYNYQYLYLTVQQKFLMVS